MLIFYSMFIRFWWLRKKTNTLSVRFWNVIVRKKERERNINIFFFSKDVRISEAYYTLKENMTLELKRKRACLITNARYKLVEFRERHAKYRGSNRCDD